MTLHLKTKNTPTHTPFLYRYPARCWLLPRMPSVCLAHTLLVSEHPPPCPSGPLNAHFASQAPSHPSRSSFSSCPSFLIFSRATLFPVHGFGNVWPPEEFICPNPSLCPSAAEDVPQTSICQDSCKTQEGLDVLGLKLED